MDEIRTIDTRDSIKVVTKNELIMARGLSELSLKSRKVLYLALSQCEQTDTEFYTYEVSLDELSALLGVGKNHVYETIDIITSELMGKYLEARVSGQKKFRKINLFSMCECDNGLVRFKLNPDLTTFLLGLQRDFTQLLLQDTLRMQSVYSISIWHLMQKAMHSRKPGVSQPIEFELSLEELRTVTGTEDKFPQIGMWKVRILDKAIREIEDNDLAKITYTHIKEGRKIVGFHFIAESIIGTYHPTQKELEKIISLQSKLSLEEHKENSILG